jgi:hypothetical protein
LTLISLMISVPCAFLSSLSAGQRDDTLVPPCFTTFGSGALGQAVASDWGPSMLWKSPVRGVR